MPIGSFPVIHVLFRVAGVQALVVLLAAGFGAVLSGPGVAAGVAGGGLCVLAGTLASAPGYLRPRGAGSRAVLRAMLAGTVLKVLVSAGLLFWLLRGGPPGVAAARLVGFVVALLAQPLALIPTNRR